MTGTEIAVAVPSAVSADVRPRLDQLVDYFNRHYELYGRRLRLVDVAGGASVSYDPVGLRSLGDEVAALNVFASLDFGASTVPPATPFHQALGRNGVISLIVRETPYSDKTLFDELHPYVWGVNPSLERIWAATASLVCNALKDRPAAHAGEALRSTTRKFGLIVQTQYSASLPFTFMAADLRSRLADCGVSVASADVDSVSGDAGRIAIEQFKQKGVTSILCACQQGPQYLATVLNNLGGYEPELLLPSLVWSGEATERDLESAPATYTRHIFGIHHTAKMLPYQARPFYGAMVESDPAYGLEGNFRVLEGVYRQLLILAAGVQTAGPTLTPDTFAAGLMSTQFPNPGAGQAPFWQPAVGFGPGDHTFHDDVALAWWNPQLVGTSVYASPAKPGAWCFLGGGTRFDPGEIPADADSRFFNPAEPCR